LPSPRAISSSLQMNHSGRDSPLSDDSEFSDSASVKSSTSPTELPASGLTISLSSFGHRTGGGAPAGLDFTFNLSHVPSPSKYLRTTHTGLSRRLQKELFQTANVESIYQRVCTEIVDFVCVNLKRKHLKRTRSQEDDDDDDKSESEPMGVASEEAQARLAELKSDFFALQSDSYDFHIGVGCDKGIHRSVAFVERLRQELPSLLKLRVESSSLPIFVNVSHIELEKKAQKRSERQQELQQKRELINPNSLDFFLQAKQAQSDDDDDENEKDSETETTTQSVIASRLPKGRSRASKIFKGKGNARRFHKHAVTSGDA